MSERRSLFDLLAQMSGLLDAANRRYALVGGLAVSVRGEVRFTRDVALAVAVQDDPDAEAVIFGLRNSGFMPVAGVEQEATGRIATVRLRAGGSPVVDLMFASSGIESQIVAAATLVSMPQGPVPVASLEHLIALKILSVTAERPQDEIDLRGLLARPADLQIVRHALDEIAAAGCAREQDLRAKLLDVVARCAP